MFTPRRGTLKEHSYHAQLTLRISEEGREQVAVSSPDSRWSLGLQYPQPHMMLEGSAK